MVNLEKNPVEWAGILYELDDLKEHLDSLIKQMSDEGKIDETDYEIQIGHLYAHLNRAWNSRSATVDTVEKNLGKYTEFPKDINTCG